MYSLKNYYPVKTNDLIRIGRNRDGGYIISKRVINKTENLIGMGISLDWSFEKDFKLKNKNIKIFAFDYSISTNDFLIMTGKSINNIFSLKQLSLLKTTSEKIKHFLYPVLYFKTAVAFKAFFKSSHNNYFFQKGIDHQTHDCFISVDEMFSSIEKINSVKHESLFLKMDIEGSEYKVLPDIYKYADRVNSMVIEFHELKKNWEKFEIIMAALMQQYIIVHIHGNNFAGYIENTKTPDCIELTLTKKSLFTSEELSVANSASYPVNGLDFPCYNKLNDIEIGFD